MRLIRNHLLLSIVAILAVPTLAHAQLAPPQPNTVTETAAFSARAVELVDILQGKMAAEDYFDPSFLAAIPPEQFAALTQSMIVQQGKPTGIVTVEAVNRWSGVVKVQFEKSVGTVQLAISPAAPHRVTGLRITGFAIAGDSYEKVAAEIASLPGKTGFIVAELTDTGIKPLAQANQAQALAIGSTFKLYILDELAAQVAAGKRRWSDVVPMTHWSFSSAATQNWPSNAPVTLQSLASWMISVSDNSATDTLIHVLGRKAIEERARKSGHANVAALVPWLTTVEAFALKGSAMADLRTAFVGADDKVQRQLLHDNAARLTLANVEAAGLGSHPLYIDQLEWFASPTDLAQIMRMIQRRANQTELSIMAINQGASVSQAREWDYLGYKGGSEMGVISMSYLGRHKDGRWLVVSASWNNLDAAVNNEGFGLYARRLLALAAQ